MDVADLVQRSAVSLRRAPALHMVVIGALLFGGVLLWRGSPSREWPRIVIPPQRLEIVRQAFLAENRRPPTTEEAAALLDYLVDQEVLYQYALTLGLHEQPVAQRRLAQIASFVEANPHEPRSDEERAAEAVSLGLHHGDLVVRRILIDGARRLIRAVVLTRQPDPAMVEEYLAANRELFMQPARTRITHVAVDGFKWPGDAQERATALLEWLQQESIAPEAAPALGDEPFVPSALPLLSPKDLQTRFGATFEQALTNAPKGAWFGPVASRFGYHLVWVHERQEASLPPFDAIRERVEQRFLHKVADEWLALRLQQLRAEFDIVVPRSTP
jgi:PPIC-type PPIASE domain